jgi:hypothetical protein
MHTPSERYLILVMMCHAGDRQFFTPQILDSWGKEAKRGSVRALRNLLKVCACFQLPFCCSERSSCSSNWRSGLRAYLAALRILRCTGLLL